MANLFVTGFALIALFTISSAQGTVKSEGDLRQDIFRNYDSKVRPVKRASTTVPVTISITPLSLRSMDEKQQVIVLESWMMLKWMDEYLKWDPSEYDNITELRVKPDDVWKPDVALYTATPDTNMFPVIQTQAIVFNNGMVLWVPPFTLRSRCPLPFRNYVTDRSFVECNIRMGSWTYSGVLMDIQLASEKVDLTNFEDFNVEWKLVKVAASRESKHYPCCPEEYPLVNFNVTLKRRNYYLNPRN